MSTKFAHIRPDNFDARAGGYTIAFVHDDIRGIVGYAIARCNPKDNFNRSVGRSIAKHRLDNGLGGTVKTRATKLKTIVNKLVSVIDVEIANERKLREVKKNRKK
jgi:ribosomal protein L17